ncbi:Lrp/AsnC family transcriptional regulator [Halobellus rarus]|uniref:Lrp/AsnC family transcriptional regulator n=1 Tax=Halobellus rarus TaxID=1126237 RepID=A0ABD6CVJ4_9EURY|nr:Lrp/AsnC family transcriptional regulator [Halobellus rarus]
MSDPFGDEFLDALEDADPVTDDDEDSVSSEIEQSEADQLRSEARSDGSEIETDPVEADRDHDEHYTRFDASCPWCRVGFEDVADAKAHDDCPKEPISVCRYCGEELTRRDDRESHIYSCEAYKREVRNHRAHAMRGGDGAKTGSSIRPFIEGQPHEFSAYLKYDDALSTYFGLVTLYKMHDFEEYGRLRAGLEFGGSEWNVEFGYKPCGIRAPEEDTDLGRWDWRLDDPLEFSVYVYPTGYESYEDAKQENRKRAYFGISPRWPDIESESGETISNPYDLLGIDVDVKGSYFEFEEYGDLFPAALDVLRDRQREFDWNSYTSIDVEACDSEQIHESTNIIDAEYYVRVKKGESGRVYAFDGTLHRIATLLGRERRGYAKTVRDDRECEGYYHTATIGAMRAAEVVGGHQLPKEFKHYHMRNPDAVEGTNLENPKIGVSFQHGLYDETLRWDDLDRLDRELDEGLLNLLQWSDLPVTPDHQLFVADDYFEVTGSRRFRKVIDDPLPRIEQEQDEEIRRFAVAGNLTETDVDLVDELLTDGGEISPAELAERIGCHISTAYKSLKRLGSLVYREYGHVELASKHIAKGVVKRLGSARSALENTLEEAADKIVRAETYGDESNPWSRWLDHYVDEIEENAGSADRDHLEFGWKPSDRRDAKRLIRAGAGKWAQVTGSDMGEFAREFEVSIELVEGDRVEFDWRDLKELLPRTYSLTAAYG